MRLLIVSVALALMSASTSHAGCHVHPSCRCGNRPHFFSAPCQDKLYRMGLTRMPASGDMHAHAPYETWEIYYYDRPYQARQSGDRLATSVGILQSALAPFYEVRERQLRNGADDVDLLEYAE